MKTPRRQPRDVADLARLLTALKADEDHSLASRITRDEAVRRSQSDELESSERIWQWLEHVDADGRRLAHETRALLARISLSMAVAGALVGWCAVIAAFYYDGSARVNVLAVVGAVVLLPLFALLASWYAIAVRTAANADGLKGIAGAISRLSGGRAGLWFARFFPSDGNVGLDVLMSHTDPEVAAVRRWLLARWSHLGGTAFFVSALASAMALITFTDLAFGWSTTLDVLSSEVHRIVQRWSWPWSWLWPSAVPSLDLVDATRFFRITETEVISEDASRFGQWWPFVMASIAIYGFVPRAVSYWIANQRCARAVGVASQTNRHCLALLERLVLPRVQTRSLAEARMPVPDAGDERVATQPHHVVTSGTVTNAVNWSAVPLSDETLKAFTRASSLHHAGSSMDLEAEESLVKTLRDDGGLVRIVVKAWEPPLLDFADFIECLSENEGCQVEVLPIAVDGQHIARGSERDLGVWSTALASTTAAMIDSHEDLL